MKKRVVITGVAGYTPIGDDWNTIKQNITAKKNGVVYMKDWDNVDQLKTRLAAPVKNFETPDHYARKKIRTMGRVSLLATCSTERALAQAGLLNSAQLCNGSTGIAYGSTYGSPPAFIDFANQIGTNRTLESINGTLYIKFMSHTCAANVGQFFEIKGRTIPSTAACVSGSQCIGFGYEAIAHGLQDIMVTGGAEEMHHMGASVFDIMFATSTKNQEPDKTPRPFDRDSDGLVVGEGASTMILESLESAQKRGAKILGEIVSFATTSDGSHMVNPSQDGMTSVMQLALDNAKLDAKDIDYVNAHGTATKVGDITETNATYQCFKRKVPISSLKSYTGHTLGACGAIEAWISMNMLHEGWVAPTINLENIDPACGDLEYLTELRKMDMQYIMSNNFAFGGINTSLIFKKWMP